MSDELREAAIRARLAAASPGPWKWEEPSEDNWPQSDQSLMSSVLDEEGFADSVLSGWGYDASGIDGSVEDRAFIAHAREDIPYLLAEVQRLRDEIAAGTEPGGNG